MKNLLFSFTAVWLFSLSAFSQAPQAFNYQGMARDVVGFSVGNKEIAIKVNILKGDKNGEVVYEEEHLPTTNKFGIFNVRIGEGNPIQGSFEDIDWGEDIFFTQVDMDIEGGSEFVSFGASQLYSVPYALYAAKSGNSTENGNSGELTLEGNILSLSEENSVDLSGLISEQNWTPIDSGLTYDGKFIALRNSDGNASFSVFQDDSGGAFLLLGGDPNSGSLILSPLGGMQAIGSDGNLAASIGEFVGSGYVSAYSNSNLIAEMSADFTGNGQISTYNSEQQQLVGLESFGTMGALNIYGNDNERITLQAESDGTSSLRLRDEQYNTLAYLTAENDGGTLKLYNKDIEMVKVGNESNDSVSYGHMVTYNNVGNITTEIDNSDNGIGGAYNVFSRGNLAARLTPNILGSGTLTLFDFEEKSMARLGSFNGGRNGALALHNDHIFGSVFLSSLESKAGFIQVQGPNNSTNILLTTLVGYPNHGFISVKDSNGETKAGIYIDQNGEGRVFADHIDNIIDHPTKSNKKIVLSTLQGPESATYLRGTAQLKNGSAFIEFPEYFSHLVSDKNMTVMITPLSAESKGIAVVKKESSGFRAKELFEGSGSYEFDWEVKARRKGTEHQKAIRNLSPQPEDISEAQLHGASQTIQKHKR